MSGVWLPAFKSLMKKVWIFAFISGAVMLRYQQPGETTLLWKILYDRAVTFIRLRRAKRCSSCSRNFRLN